MLRNYEDTLQVETLLSVYKIMQRHIPGENIYVITVRNSNLVSFHLIKWSSISATSTSSINKVRWTNIKMPVWRAGRVDLELCAFLTSELVEAFYQFHVTATLLSGDRIACTPFDTSSDGTKCRSCYESAEKNYPTSVSSYNCNTFSNSWAD